MSARLRRPYGSWKSPIVADLIAADAVGLGGICLDGEDMYWSELRGAEGGRNAIVRSNSEGDLDILPSPYSARSRVNEYGGGAFTAAAGVVYFSNNADQRIYRLQSGVAPSPITPPDARRYADLIVDRTRSRIIAVCEDHRGGGEPKHALVSVDAAGASSPVTIAQHRDFYASPRISEDGRRFAFIAWDHPNMPWDGTDLYVAEFKYDGELGELLHVAGGKGESIVQPTFGRDGALYFISDRTGWWNLYRWCNGKTESLLPRAAEFAGPQWVFGLSTYAFTESGKIICACNDAGAWRLGVYDNGGWRSFDLPYTDVGYVQAQGERVVFLGASPTALPAVIEFNLATERSRVIRRSATLGFGANYFSVPDALEYETGDGERAHAFFYRPHNADFAGPSSERPPLIVMSHGGPTTASSSALNLKIQYWTSRGFAVLDVNYRGSTGYGRAYRDRLHGNWGVIDVEDCVKGARYLVEQGEVDGSRLIIRGGSAGGYTTLCALTFHQVFRAGASHYGISDLELLAHDTHKFESRYLERLIGPYPQTRSRYRERSPIHYADRLNCPVIFFQGAEDRVVPPEQTERLVQALRARTIPVAYLLFPGEQHGFRRSENIRRALETELRFYGHVFSFSTDVDENVTDPLI